MINKGKSLTNVTKTVKDFFQAISFLSHVKMLMLRPLEMGRSRLFIKKYLYKCISRIEMKLWAKFATFLINKMSWLFLCKKEEQKLFITFLARIVRGVSSRTIGLILDKYINIARGTKSSFRPM